MEFIKIETNGNDYLFFDFLKGDKPKINYPLFAKKISNRRFGVGSDGIVLIEKSVGVDVKLIMFNSDGNQGNICGSALCSSVLYLSKGQKRAFQIMTYSGVKSGILQKNGYSKIYPFDPKIIEKINFAGRDFYKVNVGNLHFVHICKKIPNDFKSISEEIEKKYDVNIEFAKKLDTNSYKVRVWERGSKETFACGSGAVAVAKVVNYLNNFTENIVKIKYPGGDYLVEKKSGITSLVGKSKIVFTGQYEII